MQRIQLLEICRCAVFDVLEYAVECCKALEARTHSYLGYRYLGIKEQSFCRLGTPRIDVLKVGHRIILLEYA